MKTDPSTVSQPGANTHTYVNIRFHGEIYEGPSLVVLSKVGIKGRKRTVVVTLSSL